MEPPAADRPGGLASRCTAGRGAEKQNSAGQGAELERYTAMLEYDQTQQTQMQAREEELEKRRQRQATAAEEKKGSI